MSLGDDLEAAERRARSSVLQTQANLNGLALSQYQGVADALTRARAAADAGLDRYAAVCRLTGRWVAHVCYRDCGTNEKIAAELARLMEGVG